MLSDLITLAGGLKNCLADQAPDGLPGTVDAVEYEFLRAKVVAVIGGSIFNIVMTSLTTAHAKPDATKEAIAAYWLFQLSNMFMNLSKIDGYMFTGTGARRQNWDPAVYQSAIQRRFRLQIVSLAAQVAADGIMHFKGGK